MVSPIDQLADDVRAKVLANMALIERARGRVILEVIRKDRKYEVSLKVTV